MDASPARELSSDFWLRDAFLPPNGRVRVYCDHGPRGALCSANGTAGKETQKEIQFGRIFRRRRVSLRGLKPATDLRVKTGQGFDELKLLFPGFCGVFFDQTRCAGLAGFECG